VLIATAIITLRSCVIKIDELGRVYSGIVNGLVTSTTNLQDSY